MSVDPTTPETEPWLEGWDPNAENAQEEYERRFAENMFGNRSLQSRYAKIQSGQVQRAMVPEDLTDMSIATGYGSVEGDTEVPLERWIQNPLDYRSNSQSPAEKILNGAAKMLVTAGTTYLDNTAGLVAGLMEIRDDLYDDNPVLSRINDPLQLRQRQEGFKPLEDFIDTPFAEWMQQARDWSEQVFPNYRTQEELEDEDHWWRHMNANFWGDTVIKNFGFTIGAGLAGATFAKGFNNLRGQTADKAYKAALAASQGDGEAQAAFQKVLQGGRMQSPKKIYDTFAGVQDSFRKLDIASQIIGGVGGALGESRMEALNAAKEFRDDTRAQASERFERDKAALADRIVGDEDFLEEVAEVDEYGRPTGRTTYTVNQAGKDYWDAELASLQENYDKTLQMIDQQATNLANTTFGMNMPLLTASNIVMFGKLFSGGYKTQAKSLVKGTFGNYKPKGSLVKGIGKGILNATSEGIEELSQKIISEGSKAVGSSNMASFYNKKYDKDAIRDVSESILDFMDSAGNVLVDPKSWEEFAVGFLTGALGVPSHVGVSNWSGGILGGIQEGLNERNTSRRLAHDLNELVKDEKFQNAFGNMVRQRKLETMKEDDLASGNEFAWHTHDDEQLMNGVMMFADAGRLDDLEAYADSLGRVDSKELQRIKPLLVDETDKDFDKRSDAYLMSWLRERANNLKRTITQYRDFYNSIDYLSFGTTDKEAIKELVFSQAQLENFERRYNEVLDRVLDKVRPELQEIAAGTGEKAERARKILSSEDNMRRLFGGLALDIKARAQDSNPSELSHYFRMIDDVRQKQILEDLNDLGVFAKDRVTKQEVQDLQKLVLARQNYYAKLFDPKGRQTFAQSFKEAAVKPEKVAEDLQKDARKQAVADAVNKLSAATNFKEFIDTMNALPDFTDAEANNMFQKELETNPSLNKYWTRFNNAAKFVSDLQDAISEKEDKIEPGMINALESVSDALHGIAPDVILSNLPEGADDLIEIGRALLNAVQGQPDSEAMVRSMLSELLGDRAQAAGLGVLPGGGPGPGTGSGGGQGGGQGSGGGTGDGTQTKEQIRKDIDDFIAKETDRNNTVLNNLANGIFTDYPDVFDDNEKAEIAANALAKLTDLKRKAGIIVDAGDAPVQNDDKDPIAKARARDEFMKMDTGSISGSHPSVYDTNLLPKGVAKRNTKGGEGVQATIDWMMNHNVQDFIDSGALAYLEQKYEKTYNKKLPIYFIANPHYVENNIRTNPFVVKSDTKYKVAPNVLLAVEMNDENRVWLHGFEDNGVFGDSTLVTVNDNGHNTQYQVIGEMWSPTPKEIEAHKNDGYGQAYQNVRTEAQRIWEHAIANSILPHYNDDVKKNRDFSDEGRWYVARIHPTAATQESDIKDADWSAGDRMYTTLNYIMSGRNMTRASENAGYEKIPLASSLSDYMSYGGEVHFAIPTTKDGIKYSAGSPKLHESISAPFGSLWMATREANGAYAWTYVTVAQADEFDFEANANTGLVQRINRVIDLMLAPQNGSVSKSERKKDFESRLRGARELSSIFYMGEGNTVALDFSNGPAAVVGGVYCKTRDEVISALISGKYKFQVDADSLNSLLDGELLKAGVLRSEMRSFIRRGATIGVNFIVDTDENGNSVAPYVRQSIGSIARTAGDNVAPTFATFERGIANVRIGEAGYRLSADGTVRRMSSRLRAGEEVTNKVTVAEVKAIAELISSDQSGAVYPGRRWIIDDKYQYTEMYERDINGVTVHIVRRGKKSAYEIVFSDTEWKDLMDSGLAKPVESKYNRPEPAEAPENPAADDAAMYAAYAEDAAKREGGTAAPQGKARGGGRPIGAGIGGRIRKKGQAPSSPTVQEMSKDEVKNDDAANCGAPF